jgi:lipoate---protein ligase
MELTMELFNLGKVPWKESQLLYHALAFLGRESLCLLSPATPYVCIGFHQDVEQEVDLEFCRTRNIPVFRREVGGGAVFLDGQQLFFQLILKRDNPSAPRRIDAFYKKFLQPVINVHHRIGIAAEYKPVNDLVVEARKISGTGAAEIGDCVVFVGNLILDFDYGTMSRVLKIPDEKFRDKVKKTIEDNLSTILRELGEDAVSRWDEAALNHMMAEEFQKILAPMSPGVKDPALISRMQELESEMDNDDWLYMRGKRVAGRVVKIRAGLEVIHRMHKATGGLIRADFAVKSGKITDVAISGDFFCFPADTVARIEKAIEGADANEVGSILAQFYKEQNFELPGIELTDWEQLFRN